MTTWSSRSTSTNCPPACARWSGGWRAAPSRPRSLIGNIAIDPATRTVMQGGRLAGRPHGARTGGAAGAGEAPGRDAVARAGLVEALYGWEESIESNAIDVHISHLRRKLGADVIETQRGLGWRLAGGGRR